jgi:hypothetical protein
MATRLLNVLQFTDVEAGAEVSLPHGLNENGTAVIPDMYDVRSNSDSFTVSLDETNVTVTNNGGGDASCDVFVWRWHSILRQLGGDPGPAGLAVQPWPIGGGAGTAADTYGFHLVFRPGATDADAAGKYVFTDWNALYDMIEELRPYGEITLEFDGRFSNDLDSRGFRACLIPARSDGQGGFLNWDMSFVKWYGQIFSFPPVFDNIPIIIFADNCTIENLSEIGGFSMELWHDGEVNSPIIWSTGTISCRVFFMGNTNPDAKAIIIGDTTEGFAFISLAGGNFRIGPQSGAAAAPLFDINGLGFFGVQDVAAQYTDNCFGDTVGGGFLQVFNDNDGGVQGADFTYDFPELDSAGSTFLLTNNNHIRNRIFPIVTPAESPYTARFNEVVRVNTTAGPVTVNLPDQHGRAVGEGVTVKDVGGNAAVNNITVAAVGTNTIDGGATDTIAAAKGFRKYVSDGEGAGDYMLVASE